MRWETSGESEAGRHAHPVMSAINAAAPSRQAGSRLGETPSAGVAGQLGQASVVRRALPIAPLKQKEWI